MVKAKTPREMRERRGRVNPTMGKLDFFGEYGVDGSLECHYENDFGF